MPVEGRRSSDQTSQGSLGTAPYLAKIVNHLDPQFQGGLEVTLMRESGNQIGDETQTYTVKYAPHFYGTTAYEYMGKNNDFNDTQKSYGLWAVPPDVGVTGIVIFINGDPANGFWIACVQDKFTNHMVPAIGGTTNYETETDYDQGDHPLPVGEHNRKANAMDKNLEIDKIDRPPHPIAERFQKQGLIRDEFRGTSSSTVRRDVPNMVFGMSTPGPIDRLGKKGYVGNRQSQVLQPVSRLGGTQFVMDDGDDRYYRKTKPTDGPPEYQSFIEEGLGDPDIPYNEHFRIRTRTGHQILFHNSEDLIYIGNARGTTWIELTSDGKIDIFAQDSVSVRTKQDFNFYADRDINIEAGRNFNLKVNGEMHTHVLKDSILIVDENQKIHVKKDVDITFDSKYLHKVASDFDLNVGGHIWQTSGGTNETKAGGNIIETAPNIHMNGPTAATAAEAQLPKSLTVHNVADLDTQSAADDTVDLTTILRRVPTPEAYPHHENLNPIRYKPIVTDRDSLGRYEGETHDMSVPPTDWKEYKKPKDNPF
jgi:hypothetical protein